MKSLDGDVKIPTVIAKDSEIRPNHISKVLAELKAHELVECINPEVRKGRLYRLTDKGDEIVKNLKWVINSYLTIFNSNVSVSVLSVHSIVSPDSISNAFT